ncbi:hypothetical protein [Roseibium aggregatum]|uniref:Uncharacterized protein n=1 Tax=Roseibium aggregatum TaxID=187304 RepID=A0A939IZV6_9HYPH|nr:hypothetical protein [Roseibium aggregatum]MBN9670451.1 hypothetical protein [Roseibium aggregatum]
MQISAKPALALVLGPDVLFAFAMLFRLLIRPYPKYWPDESNLRSASFGGWFGKAGMEIG